MTPCAVDCCPYLPVVRLSYTAARTPRSYRLCEDHRTEAHAWVRSRLGNIPITEEPPDHEALQPALFASDEVGQP